MLLVDDGRVVSARRTVRVKRRNSLAVGVNELRNVVLMNHRIIRRDADLSAVLKLAVGDAFGGTLKGRSLFDERRAFSPEFYGDRYEIFTCGFHHRATDGRASSENKMIERQG